jgi:hypothetical protein
MRRALVLGAALASVSGCGFPRGTLVYPNNDETLGAAAAARQACSCLFVMKRSEAFCQDWVRVSPDLPRWSADLKARRVEASVLVSWSASARYVDDRHGCVLE